jgi:hypothetical protein
VKLRRRGKKEGSVFVPDKKKEAAASFSILRLFIFS